MSYFDASSEEQIRQRAYALWKAAGEPEGREDEFWHRAQSEIAEAQMPQPEVGTVVTHDERPGVSTAGTV